MPRGDGTGPMGGGPMTGRAAGLCAGYPAAGCASIGWGGSGWGRGGGGWGGGGFARAGRGPAHRGGWGRGKGFGPRGRALPGWGLGPAWGGFRPVYRAAPADAEFEAEELKREADRLKAGLRAIEARLEELEPDGHPEKAEAGEDGDR